MGLRPPVRRRFPAPRVTGRPLPPSKRPLSLIKRSLSLSGHRTSVALEPEFWAALDRLAASRGLAVPALIERLDAGRDPSRPLASFLRVLALEHAADPPSAPGTES